MFQRVLIVFTLAVVLGACGCASRPPEIKAKGNASIPAQTDTVRPQATVHLFDEVLIHLPPIQTPGNVWTIVLNDERYLDPEGPIVSEPDGGAVAKFLAIRGGRRSVRFFALPPKVKEAVPTQRYEIRISIEDRS